MQMLWLKRWSIGWYSSDGVELVIPERTSKISKEGEDTREIYRNRFGYNEPEKCYTLSLKKVNLQNWKMGLICKCSWLYFYVEKGDYSRRSNNRDFELVVEVVSKYFNWNLFQYRPIRLIKVLHNFSSIEIYFEWAETVRFREQEDWY